MNAKWVAISGVVLSGAAGDMKGTCTFMGQLGMERQITGFLRSCLSVDIDTNSAERIIVCLFNLICLLAVHAPGTWRAFFLLLKINSIDPISLRLIIIHSEQIRAGIYTVASGNATMSDSSRANILSNLLFRIQHIILSLNGNTLHIIKLCY